jgi:L-amino acid N-acyltransferase YncA
MVSIKLVNNEEELKGIQVLQQQNLRKYLTESEALEQGFVTAEYSIEFLQNMHRAAPSVIAVADGKVVGYSLVALKSIREEHILLADLFNTIDHTKYQSKDLSQSDYVVVGQLCVGKGFRGIGLVEKLYQYFKDCYSNEFEYCITDVAQENQRSLKAHQKRGFQVIDTLMYGGFGWDIVLWDWNKK